MSAIRSRLALLGLAPMLLLLVGVGGCSNEGAGAGISAALVGTACTDDSSCGFAHALCVTDFPGGYCTFDCDAAGCPSGTLCVQYPDGGFHVCAATCTVDEECRNGYFCRDGLICDAIRGGDPTDVGLDADESDVGPDAGSDVAEDTTPAEDTGATEDTAPTEDTGTVEDTTPIEDTGTVEDTTPAEDTGTVEDTSPDTTDGPPIGSTCTDDSQCTEGPAPQCVTWIPEGYCSSGCEDDTDCGAGNVCASAGFGPTLCLDGCATDADCRDGFGCCGWAGNVCLPSWSCF